MNRPWVDVVGRLRNVVVLAAAAVCLGAAYVISGADVFYWSTLIAMIGVGFCAGLWVAASTAARR